MDLDDVSLIAERIRETSKLSTENAEVIYFIQLLISDKSSYIYKIFFIIAFKKFAYTAKKSCITTTRN